MTMPLSTALAHGRSDAQGKLVEASARLSELQFECGGDLPGIIAIPALRELERKVRLQGLKLARTMRASNGHEAVTAWVEIEPEADGGTTMRFASWQAASLPPEDPDLIAKHRVAIDRSLAELMAQLDQSQCLLSVESEATDLAELCSEMAAGRGRPWTEFVAIDGSSHLQPMHWRLLDGVSVAVPGSQRKWRVRLVPQYLGGSEPAGFELYLCASAPLGCLIDDDVSGSDDQSGLFGQDLARTLRQPISRIINNSKTIRMRMAGPLSEEYTQYAADMASAGEHLLALIDDLSDLEEIEAKDFKTVPERVDSVVAIRRAVSMLLGRAQAKGIIIDAPQQEDSLAAIGEFRRVLQILLRVRTHKLDSHGAVDVIHRPPARRIGGWRISFGFRMSSGLGSSRCCPATRAGYHGSMTVECCRG